MIIINGPDESYEFINTLCNIRNWNKYVGIYSDPPSSAVGSGMIYAIESGPKEDAWDSGNWASDSLRRKSRIPLNFNIVNRHPIPWAFFALKLKFLECFDKSIRNSVISPGRLYFRWGHHRMWSNFWCWIAFAQLRGFSFFDSLSSASRELVKYLSIICYSQKKVAMPILPPSLGVPPGTLSSIWLLRGIVK